MTKILRLHGRGGCSSLPSGISVDALAVIGHSSPRIQAPTSMELVLGRINPPA